MTPNIIKRIYNTFKLRQVINQPTQVNSDTKLLIDHMATDTPDPFSHSGVFKHVVSVTMTWFTQIEV